LERGDAVNDSVYNARYWSLLHLVESTAQAHPPHLWGRA